MKTLDTALPFHDSNRHLFNKDVEGYQQVGGVLTPSFEVIAFQVRTRSTTILTVDRFELFEVTKLAVKTGNSIDLADLIPELIIEVYDGFAYVINEGQILTELVQYSDYIFEIDYGGFTYTSELLTVFEANLAQFQCSGHYALDYFIGYSTDVEAGVTVVRTDIDGSAFGFNFITFRFDFTSEEVKVIETIAAAIGDPAKAIQSLIPLPAGVGVGSYEVEISGVCGNQTLPFQVIDPVVYVVNVTSVPLNSGTSFRIDSIGSKLRTPTEIISSPSFFTFILNDLGEQVVFNYDNSETVSSIYIINYPLTDILNIEKYTNLLSLELIGSVQVSSVPANIDQCTLLELVTFYGIDSLAPLSGNINLETITVYSGTFTDIPSSISSLVNLVTMKLKGVLSVVPTSVNQLVSLLTLDLDGNNLTVFPQAVSGIPNLETLILINNPFTLVHDDISLLTSLENLALKSIAVFNLEICNIPTLKVLQMTDCADVVIPSNIGNLVNMEVLFLDSGNFTAIPSGIGNLVNMTIFSLKDCFNIISYPATLVNLVNVALIHMNLGIVTYGALQSLPMSHVWFYVKPDFVTYPSNLYFNIVDEVTLDVRGGIFNAINAISGLSNSASLRTLTLYNTATLCPSNISLLTLLTELEFQFMNAVVPPSIVSLVNLETMRLTGTSTAYAAVSAPVYIIPVEIYLCVSLKYFWVSALTDFTTLASGINALTNLLILSLRGGNLTTITTDVALLFNILIIDISRNKLLQTEVEALLNAFDTNKLNYTGSVNVNMALQTPAINYTAPMLAIIDDLEDNHNFTFTI